MRSASVMLDDISCLREGSGLSFQERPRHHVESILHLGLHVLRLATIRDLFVGQALTHKALRLERLQECLASCVVPGEIIIRQPGPDLNARELLGRDMLALTLLDGSYDPPMLQALRTLPFEQLS